VLTLDVPENDDDEGGLDPIITSIALHRIVAVTLGVLWGMFITSYIWPISARHDMRVGLSELYLHLGWFFRIKTDEPKLNRSNGSGLERADSIDLLPLSKMRPVLNQQQELALQGLLVHLEGLLAAAANEPRLKGPFPKAEYRKMLSIVQDILDTLSHFRVTLMEEIQSQSDTVGLLRQIDSNIHDICDHIFLCFYRILSFFRDNCSAGGLLATEISCSKEIPDTLDSSRSLVHANRRDPSGGHGEGRPI
jgi:hypothetical protein